eukprot:15366305-Ditylum_brightwellii.AAC.2
MVPQGKNCPPTKGCSQSSLSILHQQEGGDHYLEQHLTRWYAAQEHLGRSSSRPLFLVSQITAEYPLHFGKYATKTLSSAVQNLQKTMQNKVNARLKLGQQVLQNTAIIVKLEEQQVHTSVFWPHHPALTSQPHLLTYTQFNSK